jgi:hypothetical protein
VLVWLTIIGLLGIVVTLAGVDALNTVASGAAVRRQLRKEMREGLANDLKGRRAPAMRDAGRGER